MTKIDAAILEALAAAMTAAVQELDVSAGTEQEHICWVRVNFIRQFAEDMFFLNNHAEDQDFLRRYGNLIIRNMLEQLIEFLYLMNNPHLAKEFLGLTINLEEINRRQSVVKKEELFGEKRYNQSVDGRLPVADMAAAIGEKSSGNGNLTLYKVYKILSEQCHNSYFSSLIDDVNKVHLSVSASGLSENQIKDVHIMALIVLDEFKSV